MLLNAFGREVICLCVILAVGGISALARVDNNWPHKRPNITVAQNQQGHAGYRPDVVGYQQPFGRNQTHAQTYNNQQQHNNRSQYQQPNQPHHINAYKPQQQPSYGQGTFNQTRASWPQPAATNQPKYPQAAFNRSQPTNYPQYTSRPLNTLNHTRPSWPQPSAPNQPQYPAYRPGSLNQTRPYWQQPNVPQHPQYPSGPQNTLNHTRPAWPQPSAPQSPIYPAVPNNFNNRPAIPLNSWTPPANQTLLYPQLPNANLPQPPAAVGNNGIPLAPLQPAPQNPQGPQNWHSGGQAVLSYGPGYYPSQAGSSNKNPPINQGSTNPYANMFN